MAMAIEVRQRLHQGQINAIALGLDERDYEVARQSQREQRAFERARDELADRLLKEVWAPGAAVDIGVWGPSIARAEADKLLRDAVERGMVYLDLDAIPEHRRKFKVQGSKFKAAMLAFFER